MFIEWSQSLPRPILEQNPASWLPLVADCCQAAEGIPFLCRPRGADGRPGHTPGERRLPGYGPRHRRAEASPRSATPRARPPRMFPSFCAGNGTRTRGRDAGDILISWEHVLSQAEEYGHSPRRELSYLLAHGLFHLMGYDHQNPTEQKEMRRMEEKAMRMAGLPKEDAPTPPTDDELLALARLAMRRSYSPYSRYPVGASLLCEDGRVFQGCNIENASFGLANCAERTALFKAVSEGAKEFTAIAIAAEGSAPYPCGACRQVLNEFAPDIRVLVTWGDGRVEKPPSPSFFPRLRPQGPAVIFQKRGAAV